jgi:hypothetical protein
LLLVVAGVIALAAIGDFYNAERKKYPTPAQDPYDPACARIREWLADKYGKDDVEVVSWGKQTVHNDAVFGGSATLSVRYRVRHGGKFYGVFHFGPGWIIESWTISD